jgi:hypothetical protein
MTCASYAEAVQAHRREWSSAYVPAFVREALSADKEGEAWRHSYDVEGSDVRPACS